MPAESVTSVNRIPGNWGPAFPEFTGSVFGLGRGHRPYARTPAVTTTNPPAASQIQDALFMVNILCLGQRQVQGRILAQPLARRSLRLSSPVFCPRITWGLPDIHQGSSQFRENSLSTKDTKMREAQQLHLFFVPFVDHDSGYGFVACTMRAITSAFSISPTLKPKGPLPPL